jgi:hypothetical protein
MRPYLHAISSASQRGGHWQDYLAVHEFLDSTKALCPDIRHRMILHSVDFGAALTRMAFPDRGDTDEIVRQHIVEDLGTPRRLSDWLGHCRLMRLPPFYPGVLPIDLDRILEFEIAKSKTVDDALVRKVFSLLTMPMTFAPDFGPEASCILGNSFGPALVRRLIGPPVESNGMFFDPALCAERIIYGLYRNLPPMTAIVHSLLSSHQTGSDA